MRFGRLANGPDGRLGNGTDSAACWPIGRLTHWPVGRLTNMAEGRKIPIRTCVGCRQERPRGEMLRVVRTPGGRVVIDRTGKTAGRGAYLCPDRRCFEQAVKKKRLGRTLRTAVPEEVYSQMEQWLDGWA